MTAVEQVLSASPGETLQITPDLCVLNDDLTHALPELNKGVAPEMAARTLVILDHDVPAGSFDTAFRQKALIDLSRQYGLPFVQAEGIGYALLCRRHLRSGQLYLGWGEHAGAVGAVGALGLQVESRTLGEAIQSGVYALRVPRRTGLRLCGALPAGADGYAAALSLLPGRVGEYRDQIVLLNDDTDGGLDLSARMALCQMLHRFGAASALFLEREEAEKFVGGALPTLSLSDAAPSVVLPGCLAKIEPLSALAPVHVDACFLGGCCGGHLDSLRRAAALLRGNRIRRELRLTVGFADNETYLAAMGEGLVDIFLDCGAQVTNPGCASCRTTSIGVVGNGEVLASTGCYNYPGCCGTPASSVYLASAETVARAALSGYLNGKEGGHDAL